MKSKYPIEDCIGSRVRSISRKIDGIYRKHLRETGITENQLSIMMALSKTGLVEQKMISEILNLEKSSLSRNLIRLTKMELVTKSGPINKPMIELSPSGHEKVLNILPKWEKAMDEIHQVMNALDIKAFNQFENSMKKL